MGRPLRAHMPGKYVRVTRECHNSSPLLQRGPDRTLYLSLLGRFTRLLGFRLISFSILECTIELLLQAPPGIAGRTLSALLHRLNTAFGLRYNRRHRRHGTLWNGRFHDHWLTPEETAQLLAEIAATAGRTAVRRGSPVPPEKWPWCGAYWVLAGRKCPWPLELAAELDRLRAGFGDPGGIALLRRLLQEHTARGRPPDRPGTWHNRMAAKLKQAHADGRLPRPLSWNAMVECHARILTT